MVNGQLSLPSEGIVKDLAKIFADKVRTVSTHFHVIQSLHDDLQDCSLQIVRETGDLTNKCAAALLEGLSHSEIEQSRSDGLVVCSHGKYLFNWRC